MHNGPKMGSGPRSAHCDLIFKVGGYSTYLVVFGAEFKNEIISRT